MAGLGIPVSTTQAISGAIMRGLAQQEGFLQLDGVLESELFTHGSLLFLIVRQLHQS